MQAGVGKGKGHDRSRETSGNSEHRTKHYGQRDRPESEKTGGRKQTTEIGACLKKKTG